MKRFICIIALALASCAVGPNYHLPSTPSEPQWSQPLEAGLTNRAPANVRWWELFHDPVLNSLIDRAVKTNHDLRQAEAAVRQARAAITIARADLWPNVAANGSYSRNRFSQHGLIVPSGNVYPQYNLYQAGFDAAWELDLFGGTRRAVEAAKAGEQATEYARDDVLVSLLADVAVNYIQVRGNQLRVNIALDNIRAEQDALDITRSQFQGGMASELDVAQAEAVKAATEASIPPLQSNLLVSIHHLGTLLGQAPGSLYDELSTPAPMPPAPPEIPIGLPSDLLRRRPDVRQAERQLASATAEIGVATAQLFPQFSLLGTGGLESVSARNFFAGSSQTWTVGPSMQWNIFEAGRIRANIRVQNAIQEQALESYETTVLTAFEDAENALAGYAKENAHYKALNREAQSSQRALELSKQLYSSGNESFLNVVVAETTLYNAQDQLAQSQIAIATDVVGLYKAIGGGWEKE